MRTKVFIQLFFLLLSSVGMAFAQNDSDSDIINIILHEPVHVAFEQLSVKCREIELRKKSLDDEYRLLIVERQRSEIKYNGCVHHSKLLDWDVHEEALNKINIELCRINRMINDLQISIEDNRIAAENKRKNAENCFRFKDSDYEAAIRSYMIDIYRNYYRVYEYKLLPAQGESINETKKYLSMIGAYIEECEDPLGFDIRHAMALCDDMGEMMESLGKVISTLKLIR